MNKNLLSKKNIMKIKYLKSIFIIFVIFCIITACSRIPLSRTLPLEIKSVYVPMFKNKTQEPGLEELATNFTIEEILADGRLNVVKKGNSDAWLEVTIKHFSNKPQTFDADEFNIVNSIFISAEVKVWKPGLDKPIGDFIIDLTYPFLADTRYSTVELPIDAKENLLRELGAKITQKIMSGKYKHK